jgi:hypothetical protein
MNAMRLPKILAAGSLLLLAAAVSLQAQTLRLTVTPTAISFAAADPDTSPKINANQTVNVAIRNSQMGNRTWRLTLTANGNLINLSASATIDISNISWTATPTPPFQGGTLAASVAKTAAQATGNYNSSGIFTFVFANSWTYWAGSYTQTVTFTLSAV